VASLNSGLQRAEPLGTDNPVVIRCGSELTYSLNKSYRFFVGRSVVPDDRLPSFQVRLTASVDGKLEYQSEPLVAGQAPVNFGCRIEDGRHLVLRAETVPASDLSCQLDLDQAMLVK
jgi:hypothetical protein